MVYKVVLEFVFEILLLMLPFKRTRLSITFWWLYVTGRDPETSQLNLEKAGVEVHPQTKKILGNNKEQTSVPHIFAIGDVLQVNTNLFEGKIS